MPGPGTLVRVPDDQGLPDGLAVDAEGFLWSAQWYGSCVVRYDPEGREDRRIATPAKQTSSFSRLAGLSLTSYTSPRPANPNPCR